MAVFPAAVTHRHWLAPHVNVVTPLIIRADSSAEATGKAMEIGRSCYPVASGHYRHEVFLGEPNVVFDNPEVAQVADGE